MFNQFEPTVRTAIRFLQLLNIRVNANTVDESLQNHPDWPSLICLSDTFSKLNVPNAAGSINPYNIDELPTPFLTYVGDKTSSLAIISRISETEVDICEGNSKKIITEDKINFISKWNGIYLIAEPNQESGEINYNQKRKEIIFKQTIPVMALISVGIFFFLQAIKLSVNYSTTSDSFILGIYIQYLVVAAGVIVTVLLVWYEIDQNNPLLKKVCSGLIKSDCSAILTSRQSKVFSWLSWSEIGLFFFMGSLFALLFSENDISKVISLIAWMNIISLPYIIFSIYYQAKVVQQWCVLCLSVQFLLLTGGVNVIAHGFLNNFSFLYSAEVAKAILLFLVPVLSWFSLKPYILRLQKNKDTHRQYLRLKFDISVFNMLLKKQKFIKEFPQNIGIELGNPNAKNTIVKVCNLYCKPCSMVHPEIERLLESNEDLKVKIIYTSREQESDPAIMPTRHLLAIAEELNPIKLKEALSDWHLSIKKDYDSFAMRYPSNGKLLKQFDHMAAMNKWCKATGITYTPTIFINGFELPSNYNVEDIQYFLFDALPVGQEIQ